MSELIYEPAPQQAPQAPSQYQLETTLTGKVDRKEPVVLEDKEGNKLRAPWAPKASCKKCYGRGFVGKNSTTKELIPCRKCYPWNEQK
jgi:hypothetical protein